MRIWLAAALAAAALGCEPRGSALAGACADDRGCPAGYHCVRGTGVCVRFLTPLEPDAGDGGLTD